MILAIFLLNLFFATFITGLEQTMPASPIPPADTPSFWANLYWGNWFSRSDVSVETSNLPAKATTDAGLNNVGDAVKEVTPNQVADPNENLVQQTLNSLNQVAPDAHLDSKTIFGLFEMLSQNTETSPDGTITMQTQTSEMLEKIKPYTDSFVDTSMLITLLKGYESYSKAKNVLSAV